MDPLQGHKHSNTPMSKVKHLIICHHSIYFPAIFSNLHKRISKTSITIFLAHKVTICSIYFIQHDHRVDQFLQQLQRPFTPLPRASPILVHHSQRPSPQVNLKKTHLFFLINLQFITIFLILVCFSICIDKSSVQLPVQLPAQSSVRSTTTSPYNLSTVSHKTVPETTKRKRAVPPDPESDSDYEPKSKGNQPQPSTSSAAAEKSKPLAKKPKPSPQSASNGGVYQATIRLVDVEVSFLGNKFTKQEKRFVCPFKECTADYSSWLNLKNHFEKTHKRNDLQKPVVDNTQNWRKIQNQNNRYTMSTVKLKLRSLLFDDKLVADDELKRQRQQVNQLIVSVLDEKSIELSKLTILFTSLAYFKVYDIMNKTGNDNDVDEIFSREVNWQSVLLTLKTFKRNTSKSGLSKATRLPKNGVSTFENIDDDAFFALCKELNVTTAFEEWSQNAWNTIADTFRTNFRTNIMTHLYQRLRHWFHFMLRDGKKNKEVRGKENRKTIGDKVYHTMKYLFDPDTCTQPAMVQHDLIAKLQGICKFPDFNARGRSYFGRLYFDYNHGHDVSGKPKAKKRKTEKSTTQQKKKTKRKTQSNGQRLIWFQMVPGMVRLQQWINEQNSNRRDAMAAAKPKRKRKRKRKQVQ